MYFLWHTDFKMCNVFVAAVSGINKCVIRIWRYLLFRDISNFYNFTGKFYLTYFCERKLTWNASVNNILC
jgi:hypothetical protein